MPRCLTLLLRRLAILLVRCARCGQIRKPPAPSRRPQHWPTTLRRRQRTTRPATRPRPPPPRSSSAGEAAPSAAAASAEDEEAAALKAATPALARRAGRPARNDLPTVDNKERERQKLKQVIKDHHQERRADYRAKRDARLEREAEMERQKNHRLNLTNSAAVRGAAVAREERAAQHRGFKEAALKRRQKQMPD